jgi:hypothetical protein
MKPLPDKLPTLCAECRPTAKIEETRVTPVRFEPVIPTRADALAALATAQQIAEASGDEEIAAGIAALVTELTAVKRLRHASRRLSEEFEDGKAN